MRQSLSLVSIILSSFSPISNFFIRKPIRKSAQVEFFEDDIFRVIIHLPAATDRETDNLVERDIEKQIVNQMLEKSTLSIAELTEKTKKHRSTISMYINSLKNRKIIKRTGTTKNGEWKVIKVNSR